MLFLKPQEYESNFFAKTDKNHYL
jgi:hypothetical protein